MLSYKHGKNLYPLIPCTTQKHWLHFISILYKKDCMIDRKGKIYNLLVYNPLQRYKVYVLHLQGVAFIHAVCMFYTYFFHITFFIRIFTYTI